MDIYKTEMMGNASLLKEIINKIDPEFKMPFDQFTSSYFGTHHNGEKDISNCYISVYFKLEENNKTKIVNIEREPYVKSLKTNSYLMSSLD